MNSIESGVLTSCSMVAFLGAAGLFSFSVSAQDEVIENKSIEVKKTEENSPKNKRSVRIDEEIVVTGSRIKRNAFSSSAPIQVITTGKSALAGLISAGDILRGSSLASGQQINDSFSGFVTDGGPGAQQISLRGLGGQRSLVLVNGRRWAPSGVRGSVGSVDLSSIPSGLISRYEILKDGASSVYGADAVAGVVNAITRTSIDGAELQFVYSHPEIDEGQSLNLHGVWGSTGDNWNVTVAAGMSKQTEIVQADLDYGSCPTRPRLTDQDGDGNIDNRDPATGKELCFGFIYGLAASPFGFARYDPTLGVGADVSNPNYDPKVNGTFGIPFFTTKPENDLDNSGAYYRDTRNPSVAHVQTEGSNYSLNSLGSYDFSLGDKNTSAYYEVHYNRRETNARGGIGQFFPSVPATNPTNPFGASNPAMGGGKTATPVLPKYALQDPETRVELDRINVFAGIKGDLSATWTYDAYLGYGYSSGTYERQSLLSKQVAASLDSALDADGNLVCNDLEANPGCVAADLFTEAALIRGELPADVLGYITARTKGETIYDSYQFSAHATGELFDLPEGEVLGVFGVEYRNESIDDLPDIEDRSGNIFGASAAGRTKGADKVKEVYTEFAVPILKQKSFAEELMLEVSGRWTDYDSFGDDTTYRGALNWQVVPSFRLRATTGTSFRAPALYEQFLGDQKGFANARVDPCLNYQDVSVPGDVIYDNCAQVVGNDFGKNGSQSIRTNTGGSIDLQAETSESNTYGFVWQPEEFGVSIAVNWFDIKIENTVSSLSAGGLISECYNSIGFSSPFCSRVGARNDDGFISEVDSSFINVGLVKSSGYDVDFAYEHDFNTFDLDVDGTITYLDEYSSEILDETQNLEGHFAFPHWRGDMDAKISYKEWEFNWRVDYFGSTDEGPQTDPGTDNVDRVTSTKYQLFHNFTVKYDKGENWEALFTIRNLFDKAPPLVADGSGTQTANRFLNTLPGAGYPLFGRTFVLRARYNF